MKNISFLLLLFIFFSCKKVDLNSINNLNNGKIDVIGHGGSGFQSLLNPYPTNSFSSIKYAVDGLNVDGIEIDVQISTDSILMLYHDMALEKSTNCTGCVKQYSASQIEECKYYNQYGSQLLNDANIIRLHTLLSYFQNRDKKPDIYINMKITSPCSNPFDVYYKELWGYTLNRLITEFNAGSYLFVYGEENDLNTIRNYAPEIGIVYDADSGADAINVCLKQNYKNTIISYKKISKEEVKTLHENGIKVYLWEILKTRDAVEAINKNPDGLFADNIPMVQQCLKK